MRLFCRSELPKASNIISVLYIFLLLYGSIFCYLVRFSERACRSNTDRFSVTQLSHISAASSTAAVAVSVAVAVAVAPAKNESETAWQQI